jgi:hypothetical protein
MRALGLVLLGYVLLILTGALLRVLPFEVVAPSVPVIMATYLGVTARERMTGTTAAAIAIGYLGDVLGGVPLGLGAFTAGLCALLARLITLRLLVRGRGFLMGLTFALHLGAQLVGMAARASAGVSPGPLGGELVALGGSALLSAALAVPVLRLCRLVDARFARTRRDRDAVREGWLN